MKLFFVLVALSFNLFGTDFVSPSEDDLASLQKQIQKLQRFTTEDVQDIHHLVPKAPKDEDVNNLKMLVHHLITMIKPEFKYQNPDQIGVHHQNLIIGKYNLRMIDIKCVIYKMFNILSKFALVYDEIEVEKENISNKNDNQKELINHVCGLFDFVKKRSQAEAIFAELGIATREAKDSCALDRILFEELDSLKNERIIFSDSKLRSIKKLIYLTSKEGRFAYIYENNIQDERGNFISAEYLPLKFLELLDMQRIRQKDFIAKRELAFDVLKPFGELSSNFGSAENWEALKSSFIDLVNLARTQNRLATLTRAVNLLGRPADFVQAIFDRSLFLDQKLKEPGSLALVKRDIRGILRAFPEDKLISLWRSASLSDLADELLKLVDESSRLQAFALRRASTFIPHSKLLEVMNHRIVRFGINLEP